MQLTLKASVVKSIVTSAKTVHQKRYTHPVLQYIKLVKVNNQLKVTATDLSTWIDATYEDNTSDFDRVLFKLQSLVLLTKSLKVSKKNDPLVVFVFDDGNNCKAIVEGGNTYKIETMSVDEYPDLPDVRATTSFVTDSEGLDIIYKKTGFCASTDETRQVLMGVHIINRAGLIEAAATDGHRLGKVVINNPHCLGADTSFTIRATILKLATTLLDGVVKVGMEDGMVTLEDNTTKITSRLLEGQYPAYNQLIPNHQDLSRTLLTFNRDEILNILTTAGKDTKVITNIKNGIAEFQVSNVYFSSEDILFTKSITCDCIADYQIAFNVKYLKEAIQSTTETNITLNCSDSNLSPVLIVEGQSTQLLMPIQIRQ